MIQVNGLKKAFDGFVALNGVDMHVEKGAIYGLVGCRKECRNRWHSGLPSAASRIF